MFIYMCCWQCLVMIIIIRPSARSVDKFSSSSCVLVKTSPSSLSVRLLRSKAPGKRRGRIRSPPRRFISLSCSVHSLCWRLGHHDGSFLSFLPLLLDIRIAKRRRRKKVKAASSPAKVNKVPFLPKNSTSFPDFQCTFAV